MWSASVYEHRTYLVCRLVVARIRFHLVLNSWTNILFVFASVILDVLSLAFWVARTAVCLRHAGYTGVMTKRTWMRLRKSVAELKVSGALEIGEARLQHYCGCLGQIWVVTSFTGESRHLVEMAVTICLVVQVSLV